VADVNNNIPRLKDNLMRKGGIPADKVNEFRDFVDFADIPEETTWNNYQSFLRENNEGGCRSIEIYFN
jgi:hypothetical protein